jgi:y4mF family transcriptional regulator
LSTSISSIRDLAAAVRGRRQALGLSQAEVARTAGVSRQWLIEFESGKPTAELQLMLRLLEALGLTINLEERDADRQRVEPKSQAVDLDALLDDYRKQ